MIKAQSSDAGAPPDTRALISVARGHLNARRFEEAFDLLRPWLNTLEAHNEIWLLIGAALEGVGKTAEAEPYYLAALSKANSLGQWTDDSNTPLEISAHVRRAAAMLQDGRRALIERIMAPLRARCGARELTRVEGALAIYLGDAAAKYSDPRQRPAFLFVPGMPASPYYNKRDFEWTQIAEASFGAVREELSAIMEERESVEPFSDNDRSPFRRLMGAWGAYFFFRYGERFDDNHARCPRTSAMLEKMPLCHVRNFAPETLFSFLTPWGELPPHCGVTNLRLVAHLPLIIPGDAVLTVGGEEHRWKEGSVVVFDDTYTHSAKNLSGQTRVVLLMDIWHPDLTDVERFAFSEIISAMADAHQG